MSSRTYLEMTSPDQLRPSKTHQSVVLSPVVGPTVRELTMAVGQDFAWPTQRWTDREWENYLALPTMRHWVGTLASGMAAGIVSLNLERTPEIEIDSFGLLPEHIGRGIGGSFLTEVVRLAWTRPIERIWLHTSSRDHPNALTNYLARGFRRFEPRAS